MDDCECIERKFGKYFTLRNYICIKMNTRVTFPLAGLDMSKWATETAGEALLLLLLLFWYF